MKRRGEERDLATARLAVDHVIAHVLAEAATLAEAGPRILAAVSDRLGFQMGAIWEVERAGDLLRCMETWHADATRAGEFEQMCKDIKLAEGVGLPGRVWATGEASWVDDVASDGTFVRATAAATAAGLGHAIAFPIRSGRRVLGVMEFLGSSARKPDRGLLETMEVAGGQIGQLIERERAEAEVRRSEALKTAMLEGAIDCVIAMDHEGLVIEFNPAAEQTFGYARDDAIGAELATLIIPPNLRERHRRGLQRYLSGADAPMLGRRSELTAMRSDGSEFPAEITVTRIGDEDPPMFSGYVRDITERRRHEEALRFLVEASAKMDSTLDLDAIPRRLARLSVPYLADGCMVDLRESDGSIRRVGAAAADASYEPVLQEVQRYGIDPAGPHPIARVMRTGRTEIVHDISDSFRREISHSEPYYQALKRWPARSVVVAPIKLRSRLHGTIALASFSPERSYGLEQLSVIEELAARAASAIENARLFSEKSRIARALEQSLLPPLLPVVPGVELAARFQSVAGGGQIGGDFYDVFDIGGGRWAIVTGDVSERGVDAAAVTVLARHTLRAAAVQEQSPAAMLSILNEALRSQLRELRFCSVGVGVLSIGGDAPALTVASGGHPLPLLLRGDGGVDAVGSPGVLLGIVPDPDLHEHDVVLEAGDTVVFYTNGVIETRPGGRSFGPERLEQLLAGCRELDAMSTAEHIDEAVLEASDREPRDDAVILVAKVASLSP